MDRENDSPHCHLMELSKSREWHYFQHFYRGNLMDFGGIFLGKNSTVSKGNWQVCVTAMSVDQTNVGNRGSAQMRYCCKQE